MDRHIVCFSIPTFQVALARLADPSLRTRPVAIAPSSDPRALIAEASREAQHDGVITNMSVAQARRLCPSLRFLSPHPARLRHAHRDLLDVASRFTPVWESVQPGHLYLDLTGTTRLFGFACDTAMRIRQEIAHQYRLMGVAGIGNSKLVSHIASTLVEPPRLYDVRPGSEETFLAPLPVETLPLGVASRRTIVTLLDDLNLRTLGDIARTALADLVPVFGQQATLLHTWARGVDPSLVLPPTKQPGTEAVLDLGPGELNIDRLHGLLYSLLESVCHELRQQHCQCHQLTIRLQYCDDAEVEHAQLIHPPTCWETDLIPSASTLFARCFHRRVRIRLLTVRAMHHQPAVEQLSLFAQEPDSPVHGSTRASRLTLALDHIRIRFGRRAIRWGKTHAAVCPSPRSF